MYTSPRGRTTHGRRTSRRGAGLPARLRRSAQGCCASAREQDGVSLADPRPDTHADRDLLGRIAAPDADDARRRGKMTRNRREAIAFQEEILQGLKDRILDLIGPNSAELDAYNREYERNFDRIQAVATKQEIVSAALRSDIVYCGDYHTLEQSQKTTVKILREVVRQREVLMAVEMVQAKDQPHVDRFLAGELDEEGFLRAVRYPETWGFPWEHYRMLFDFARAHGIRVVGLNFRPPGRHPAKLLRRDAFAAQILADLLAPRDHPLVWVVYGDLHVAPQHIPSLVDRILESRGEERHSMVVFQNNKRLWFRLAEKGLVPGYDAVRLGQDRFCVLNTPPWIKLQTYLDHLERVVFAHHDEEDDPPAYEDMVAHLIVELAKLLGIPEAPTDHFQLYTPHDLDGLLAQAEMLGGRQLVRRLVANARSLYFPEARLLYLTECDANHAAEAATEYLHHAGSGYVLEGRSPKDRFYLRCLTKCLGFFGSLLLNPKRKTDYFKDHDLFLKRWYRRRLPPPRELQRRISRRVVQHQRAVERLLERGRGALRLRKVYDEDIALGYGVSRSLGFIMGDKLYRAYMDGMLGKEEIREIFTDSLSAPTRTLERYLELRRFLKAVKKPFKSKDEFF